MDEFLLHDALGALWEFVGEANRFVDREQPWTLAKQAKAGDAEAADRLRGVLGDLLEACRVISLAAAPVHPGASSRVQQQLGLEFAYGERRRQALPLADAVQLGQRTGRRKNWHRGNPVSTCRKRACLIVVSRRRC